MCDEGQAHIKKLHHALQSPLRETLIRFCADIDLHARIRFLTVLDYTGQIRYTCNLRLGPIHCYTFCQSFVLPIAECGPESRECNCSLAAKA